MSEEQNHHYYMLTTDPTITAGTSLPGIVFPAGGPELVAVDARQVDVFEWAGENGVDDLVDIVLNRLDPPVRLAVLSPAGPVHTSLESRPPVAWCESGWTVTSFVPLTEAFGPEGVRLVELVRRAERDLIDAAGDSPEANRYAAALDVQYENEPLLDTHLDAAQRALRRAGVDYAIWHEIGACVYGHEVLALAARPLIGTVPGWTWEAYDGLCEPWRQAFGEPVHPDDQARHTVERRQ